MLGEVETQQRGQQHVGLQSRHQRIIFVVPLRIVAEKSSPSGSEPTCSG